MLRQTPRVVGEARFQVPARAGPRSQGEPYLITYDEAKGSRQGDESRRTGPGNTAAARDGQGSHEVETLSTLVLTDQVIQRVQRPPRRDYADLALRRVLDAEIEALTDRLLQRSANVATACGLARADRDRQIGWLKDSMAKLQARRGALC